jgi:hypothetical protein
MSLLPRQVARKKAAGYDASGGTTGSEIWGGLFTRWHAQIHLFGRSSTACLSITNSVQIGESARVCHRRTGHALFSASGGCGA